MNKMKFLRSLGAALYWRVPAVKAAEILSDYEDFFESGKADGKTEAEICAELGKPREIARELKQKNFLPKQIIINLFLIAVSVLFLFLDYGMDWRFLTGFAVVSVAALRILFGGVIAYSRKSKITLPVIIVFNSLLLGTVTAVFAVTRFAVFAPIEKLTAVFGDIERIGYKLTGIINGSKILCLGLFAVAVWGYFRYSRYYFTVCANAVCAAAMLNFTIGYLSNMGADTVKLFGFTEQSLLLYFAALVLTLPLGFIRGRKNGSAN